MKIEGTYDGKDAQVFIMPDTVWKQENGKWMAIFHMHVRRGEVGGSSRSHDSTRTRSLFVSRDTASVLAKDCPVGSISRSGILAISVLFGGWIIARRARTFVVRPAV